jgi:hypothetical protein
VWNPHEVAWNPHEVASAIEHRIRDQSGVAANPTVATHHETEKAEPAECCRRMSPRRMG